MAKPGRKQSSQKRVSILTSLDDSIGSMTPRGQMILRTPGSLFRQPFTALSRSSLKQTDTSTILGAAGKSPLILQHSGLLSNQSMHPSCDSEPLDIL
uniref:Uncharacterized protein n=1 Tax=Pavo cristatus TaxID=9049 RepID=A0A8C9LFT3_PAVCR